MVKSGIVSEEKNNPTFEMRGICKRFGATIALNNVDFSVSPGEVHALVGENGAGKSTLMKILSGVYQPDDGTMFFDGESYQPKNPLNARHSGVGMIYQELSLVPHLTVEENILLGMEPVTGGFIRWAEVREGALKALKYFDHPEIKPDTPVRKLSVSAQQLVEIGRSLAVGCRVLVFDEPTSSLSRHDIDRLFDVIKGLKDQGISIVYISHFLEEVQSVADRITVLRDGSVVGSNEIESVTLDTIVQMMVGRMVDDLYPRSVRERGEPVLEIKNLAGEKHPDSASLVLHRGEVFGICGLVGAGRTELLRVIFGLDPVRRGEIKVGAYAGPASPLKRWSQGVGFLSEDRNDEGLALNLTLADNITLSKLKGFGPLGLIFPRNQNSAVERWISQLDIRCLGPEQVIGSISGGNQQKSALARLLQHDVDVLLLDEPTRGIDVASKAKIYQVIDELATGSMEENERPKAILMISSYIPELLGVCDRIAVMYRGKLSLSKPVEMVDEQQLMLAATGRANM